MPLVYVVLEIAIFVGLAQAIGVGYTLLLFIFPSFLGLFLLSILGRDMGVKMQSLIHDGKTQPKDIVRSAAPMIGALLLVIPGFLSRALGLLFLFPPTRWFLIFLSSRLYFSRLLRKGFSFYQFGNGAFRMHTSFGGKRSSPFNNHQVRDVTGSGEVIDVVPTQVEHKISTEKKEE